jgi:nucleoside-diphosphate-sugar epimerase
LARNGHIVYGLTRSEKKSKILAAEEIIPIVGKPDSKEWLAYAATLDAVIDAVGGSANLPELTKVVLEGLTAACQQHRPHGAPKLAFIYTSGIWVHGDNRVETVTDNTPLTKPSHLAAWRLPHERHVRENTVLNGIVIRPGLVYGRGASLLAPLFESAKAGKAQWPGAPGQRFTLVHTDDLAQAYLLVTEKAPILNGIVFDVTSEKTESVDDFLEKLVKVSGAKGFEYTKPANTYEEALASTNLVRPTLARTLLGWTPLKPGLVDGLKTYYEAWLAQRQVA